MTAPEIVGIDHIELAVPDLDAARRHWTRLGFTTSPRGKDLERGAARDSIIFERSHIALVERGAAVRPGPAALAWATADAAAAGRSLAARGFHPGPIEIRSRQIELPEETALLRFAVAPLPAAETPGLSSFLHAHLTPDLMRRPEWLLHPNGTTGLAGITVVVDDAMALVEPYERLLGPGKISTTDDVLTVRPGRQRIIFATPDDFAAMHPESDLDPAVALPHIAVVTLTVRDPEATEDYFTDWQIAFEAGGGRLFVPPQEADGTGLEFVAAGR